MAACTELLGADAVVSDPVLMREFRDPYSHASWTQHEPGLVVCPTTVEQVQELVRLAGRFDTPTWTISQGRNNGYGGPAPRVPGSMVISLRGMNRILELDEELAYAVVEPGVRFFDLYEEVQRRGLKLWPSIPDLGWGSIIGNAMDHGVGFTPLGDHPARSCGMEVVLADGSLVRTGMGAMPDNPTWALRKHGFGPHHEGMLMQSNLGIVTKMGCWLVPQPEYYVSAEVTVPRDEDISTLIDTVRPLLLDGTIQNSPIAYNVTLIAGAFSGVPRSHWYTGDGAVDDAAIEKMKAETGAGAWLMRFALFGYEDVVSEQLARCTEAFARIEGSRLTHRGFRGDEVVHQLTALERPRPADGPEGAVDRLRQQSDTTQAGIPSLDLLDNLSWDDHGVGGHLDYSPVTELDGARVLEQTRWLREECAGEGLDYAASLMIFPRACINIVSLWFNTADEAGTRQAYEFTGTLIERGAERGFGAYRTHLEHMDRVAATYDWNDSALARFNTRIKDALDPQGILSPGRSGIWGSRRAPQG
ncbi:FAD-binding oxidoreductase [Nocardioides sp. GY 10127]|nr:FAD-binding oxidoreductase [Nocardioides sp. GY 10127]